MNKFLLLAGAIIAASVARPFGEGGVARASEQFMPPAVVDQMRGYVFTRFMFARPATDAATDCPQGLSMSLRDSFIAQLPPQDRPKAEQVKGFGPVGSMILATDNPAGGLKLGESEEALKLLSDAEHEAKIRIRRDPNRHTICNNPADYKGVGFHTIEHAGTGSGLNLDGTSDGAPTATTCAHKKFTGVDGTPGVDDQFWRVAGCIAVYRNGGLDWDSSIRTGDWAVLMEISAPKGGGPDGDVDVNFYSSKDSVTLDAAGKIPPGLSLEYIDDPQLIAKTHGRIDHGVLTTEPTDFTYKYDNQIVHERWAFEGARFRLQMLPDGGLKGQMGAYADADKFYGYTVKPQTIDGANANNIDCPGFYAALHTLADGHRDPKTGACSALSVAFDLQAIPAFIIHPRQTADAGARAR
jgi:hypothetical protein